MDVFRSRGPHRGHCRRDWSVHFRIWRCFRHLCLSDLGRLLRASPKSAQPLVAKLTVDRMATRHGADESNGYNASAHDFIAIRGHSAIGAEVVLSWSKRLKPGGDVLDIGCGHGVPISSTLADAGFKVYGVDASPRLVAVFREHLPNAQIECAAVQHSQWFGRAHDGIVAWGLVFLLSPDTQSAVIRKAASALVPGGHFLFTAPRQPCEWLDNLTKRKSLSLGAKAYRALLDAEGLELIGNTEDEGENYYFFACKRDDTSNGWHSRKGVIE